VASAPFSGWPALWKRPEAVAGSRNGFSGGFQQEFSYFQKRFRQAVPKSPHGVLGIVVRKQLQILHEISRKAYRRSFGCIPIRCPSRGTIPPYFKQDFSAFPACL
jgi:hypothetical protein